MGVFLPKSRKPTNIHISKYRLIQACVYRSRNIGPKFGVYEIKETCCAHPSTSKNRLSSYRYDIWHDVSIDSKKKVFSFFISHDKFDTYEHMTVDRYVDGAWTDLILEGIKDEVFL